ncbi:mitochondrial carrier domain-containing protein [Lipomyces oligophaga]|uniref:mitochondrial carrier domain-containing protein n=1 Tax=Lipomyces oligophaga TaxID=45792 RepID=UPI0034CEE89F
MIAGGIGGGAGDSSMHSLDTVKTRQQGATNAVKYQGTLRAYATIFREEGFSRGLYSGFVPAMWGSLPGTTIFFGTYEFTKRTLLAYGMPETLSYLASGFIGDFAASFIYVPSEVLKTRMQLQGRYNNPYFTSGYNYRGSWDAMKTIIRQEGWSAMFFGYKATLVRDLPFSALQLTFYERFRSGAQFFIGSPDIPLWAEFFTGAVAGGLSGVLTTPTDVIKTRIQTQLELSHVQSDTSAMPTANSESTISKDIHIKSASTSTQSPRLSPDSTIRALSVIYRTEGMRGLFAGVGPRFVWTSIQSSIMLFVYQNVLRALTGKDSVEFSA